MCRAFILVIAAAVAVGCSSEDAAGTHESHNGHKAPHGGVLNAIEKCSVGHIEALLEGDKLTLYFVGGHDRTGTSLPVKAAKLDLAVKLADGSENSLTLQASPLKLAGEDIGRCSRFEGQADFFEGIESFRASGKVEVNGVMRELTVIYPGGFHPSHAEHGHEHEHEHGHDEGEAKQ
jgi:hypothetical protein